MTELTPPSDDVPNPPGDYPSASGYPPPPPGSKPSLPGYPPPVGSVPMPPPQTDVVAALPQTAYTPWIRRVGAWIIDSLPVLLLSGIAQGMLFLFGEGTCTTKGYEGGQGVFCTAQPSTLGVVLSTLFGVAALAFAIWNYGYRQGTTGSSIGKSVLKFKVVSERAGEPIGFGPSIVRQLAHVVDAVICYIGYLFPLWDAKRQTLADKIMTTVCLPTA